MGEGANDVFEIIGRWTGQRRYPKGRQYGVQETSVFAHTRSHTKYRACQHCIANDFLSGSAPFLGL